MDAENNLENMEKPEKGRKFKRKIKPDISVKNMSKKKLLAIIVIGAICLGVIVPFLFGILFSGEVTEESTALVVNTENPQVREISNYAKIVGTVTGEDSRDIFAQIEGEVINLPVKEGQSVREGEIICVISSDQLTASSLSVQSAQAALNSTQAQVENSRIDVASAKEALETAETDLARNQELYNAGFISLTELEEYQRAVSSAKRNLQTAENSYSSMQFSQEEARAAYETQVNSNQILKDNLYIKAPAAGVIENLDIHLHDRVQTLGQICTVSRQTDMKLECNVSAIVAQSAIVGSQVTVTQRGVEYSGIVESAGLEASQETGTCKIKISFADGNAPSAGSKATALICTESSTNSLTLPSDCIYFDGNEAYVYVISDGTALKKFITTGIYNDDYMVVTGGITSSDKIITTWSSFLFDGAEVEEAA